MGLRMHRQVGALRKVTRTEAAAPSLVSASASNTDRAAPILMLSRSGTAGDQSRLQVGHGFSALTMAMPMTFAVFWLAAAPWLVEGSFGQHWSTAVDAATVFRATP